MKRKIITLLFLCFFLQKTNSQSYSDAISLNAGLTQKGFGGLISYNYFINPHDFILGGVFGSMSKGKYTDTIDIPYNDFTVTVGFSKNLYFDRLNVFNFNVSAGGVFGYEEINNGSKDLINGAEVVSKSAFIYGGFIGMEAIYNIGEDYCLLLNATEFFHANSSAGQFSPFVGIGIRYYTK